MLARSRVEPLYKAQQLTRQQKQVYVHLLTLWLMNFKIRGFMLGWFRRGLLIPALLCQKLIK